MSLSPAPLPAPPPAWLVTALLAARRLLLRLADRLLPSHLAAFEHTVGVAETLLLRELARLGVADRLTDGPRSSAQLAADLGVNHDVLHRMLRAASQRGVFSMDAQGLVSNNHVSRGLLSGVGTSRSFAAYLGDRHNLLSWDRLDEVLRAGGDGFSRVHGEGLWTWYETHEAERDLFAAMMADRTIGDAAALATAVPFPAGSTICDVGGGIGTQLSELLVRHPGTRGILFDSPRTLAQARELLAARGVLDRTQLVPGDFFADPPPPADTYLLKNVLHDWGDEPATRLLRRVREAMPPSARLLIAEAVIEPNDARHPAVLADLQMLMLCDGGRERSTAEFQALLSASGLRWRRAVSTSIFLTVIEAESA